MKPENVLLKQQGRSGIKVIPMSISMQIFSFRFRAGVKVLDWLLMRLVCLFFGFQVIDFGSSCYENQRVYTYIQSRFYRAPEVILGAKYGMPIDMWSLGCILAELLTGYALFPGEDENDQLACIIELLGMPPQKLLDQSKRAKNFFSAKGYPRYCMTETSEDGRLILGSGSSRQGKERGPPGSKNLKKALKGCDDPLFLNFLCGCLEWDPELRMTPSAALKHSWFRRRLPRPPQYSASVASSTPSLSSSLTSVTTTTNAAVAKDTVTASADETNAANANTTATNGRTMGKPAIAAFRETAVPTTIEKCTTKNRESSHLANTLNSNLADYSLPDACSSTSNLMKCETNNINSDTNTNNGCNDNGSTSIANKLRVLLTTNDTIKTNLSNQCGTDNGQASSKNSTNSIQQPLSSLSITSTAPTNVSSK